MSKLDIDLITVYPGIVLDIYKRELGKDVEDPEALNEISYDDTIIVSYKKFLSKPNIFHDNHIKYINQLHNRIIDAEGNQVDDYTIIIDKNLKIKDLTPPTPDSQKLITYISYLQGLDQWISIDFLKVISFHDGGRIFFQNNQDDKSYSKWFYMLPIHQDYKGKIKINNSRKDFFIDCFQKIKNHDIKTYRQIINAIDLFNESCRISKFNINSAIVLIVSAYESLLFLPRQLKTDTFSYAFKLLLGLDERIGEWAKDLYSLRSQIVHGEDVEDEKLLVSNDRHYPHLAIARDYFHSCLLLILERYGIIETDSQFTLEIVRELKSKIISNQEKITAILKGKKRFTYKSFTKKKELYNEFIYRMEELTPTDYSGRDNVIPLIKLVFSIAKEWIKEAKKYKTDDEEQRKVYESRNKTYDEILALFDEIKKQKTTLKGRFQLHEKIDELESKIGYFHPAVKLEDEIDFKIPEFLHICLKSLRATY